MTNARNPSGKWSRHNIPIAYIAQPAPAPADMAKRGTQNGPETRDPEATKGACRCRSWEAKAAPELRAPKKVKKEAVRKEKRPVESPGPQI